MNFSFFKLFSYTHGAFLICEWSRLEKTYFDIQISTGSHPKRKKSLQSMYRASGAFEMYARIQNFQFLTNFLNFWHILKFAAHLSIHFKGARGPVHTLKAFLRFKWLPVLIWISKWVFSSLLDSQIKKAPWVYENSLKNEKFINFLNFCTIWKLYFEFKKAPGAF